MLRYILKNFFVKNTLEILFSNIKHKIIKLLGLQVFYYDTNTSFSLFISINQNIKKSTYILYQEFW